MHFHRLSLGVILILTFATPLEGRFSSVRIEVIDVGQADALLVRTPNQQWALIDAGYGGVLPDSLGPHFGVDTLDLVFASHWHRDHIGGLEETSRKVGGSVLQLVS